MRVIKYLVGLFIGAAADMGVGLIIVHLIGKAFHYSVPFYFYPIGAFLSLLPDIDFIWATLKRQNITGHRGIPHLPIIMIGSLCLIWGILSAFWPISLYWMIVGVLCLLGHFIDDSIGSLTGIKWLAPFKKKYYVFWPPHALAEKEAKKKIKESAENNDIELIIKIFLRPTARTISGIAIFIIAVLLISFW